MIVEEVQRYSLGTRITDVSGKRKRQKFYFKDCPYCGKGVKPRFIKVDNMWMVICFTCEASTDPFSQKESAMDALFRPGKKR